ncbi:unnamed protein product, partial [Adineta steineri]
HTDDEPCRIAFCERLCFEMTTDLDETRLQVFFLPVYVYVEDSIVTAPIRLCMCNMHTSLCNESLTLKVGTIQIRQLLRLSPGSWLEAGSVRVPEIRINAKLECHPPIPTTINEQLEFLRRHDQHS